MTTTEPFEREILPGLSITIDESLCIVIRSERYESTITDVAAFVAALNEAQQVQLGRIT